MTESDETTVEAERHRRAQEAVDELVRMGIDPAVLGLPAPSETADPPVVTDHDEPAPAGKAELLPDEAPGPVVPAAAPGPLASVAAPPAPGQNPLVRPLDPNPKPRVPPKPDEADDDTPPQRPAGPGQTARAFGAGIFTVGAAQRLQTEQDLLARARSPQREPQVVSFVAGKGGVGVTTTAAGVALTLAALRDDSSALLDAQAGTASLGGWLSDEREPDSVSAEEEPGSVRLPNGLEVVDGAPWLAPTDGTELAMAIDALRQEHVFTLVDVGNDAGAVARQALASSTRVVVVTAADRHAVRATQLTLERIQQVRPERLTDMMVALVCLVRWQYQRVLRTLRGDLGHEAVVPIPYEPALAAMDGLELTRLRPRTREALLRLAAGVARPPSVAAGPGRAHG